MVCCVVIRPDSWAIGCCEEHSTIMDKSNGSTWAVKSDVMILLLPHHLLPPETHTTDHHAGIITMQLIYEPVQNTLMLSNKNKTAESDQQMWSGWSKVAGGSAAPMVVGGVTGVRTTPDSEPVGKRKCPYAWPLNPILTLNNPNPKFTQTIKP